jgi:hypothetical protein
MMSNYVIAVYVSSDPGTYMVHIRFAFQNRVCQLPSLLCMDGPTDYEARVLS